MGSDLHNALRSLCSNTPWKYAIFWKLKYRSRMVLTWEDAYYDNCVSHNLLECGGSLERLLGHQSETDHLGLPAAKLSYLMYSLGEGIVGQVAATGKHLWICGDSILNNSLQCVEFSDGMLSQFSAGIRTIVVVDVIPNGVVQLGSFDKVAEDMNFVYLVRDVFLTSQDSFGQGLSKPFSLNAAVDEANKYVKIGSSFSENIENERIAQLNYHASHLGEPKTLVNLGRDQIYERDDSCLLMKQQKEANCSSSQLSYVSNKDTMNASFSLSCREKLGFNSGKDSPEIVESSCGRRMSAKAYGYLPNVLEEPESSCLIPSIESRELGSYEAQPEHSEGRDGIMMFSAGYELHEALGPEFLKKYVLCSNEQMSNQGRCEQELDNVVLDSKCLLEAVVSNACTSGSDTASEKSVCKSRNSLLMSEKKPSPSYSNNVSLSKAEYSLSTLVKEDTQELSNSTDMHGEILTTGFSTCLSSAFTDCLDQYEPTKTKKRARPGESCRPRPRDRQLIQDRIKELRELVPNGSKCSIDSLLERTIKHMLFLECITKHADKLNKCVESKLNQKETGLPNCCHGSRWAVEVGGHFKVSSIVVENLSKNGQVLVEMLCDGCSHFLEIAEAIRGLGLTILKGVTDVQGEKTWICFVVEGQSNQVMHMDILCSLVQVLQPNTSE